MITIMKTGSPTINTKGLVGQHYIDLDSGTEYECVDIIDHRQYKKGLVKPHDFVSQKVLNGVSCEYVWEVVNDEDGSSDSDLKDKVDKLSEAIAEMETHLIIEYDDNAEIFNFILDGKLLFSGAGFSHQNVGDAVAQMFDLSILSTAVYINGYDHMRCLSYSRRHDEELNLKSISLTFVQGSGFVDFTLTDGMLP